MNRPWSVTIIFVLSILLTGASAVSTMRVRTLAEQGYADPTLQYYTLSPVHIFLLVIARTLVVAAGFFLFRLSRWARVLYLGALVSQLADLALFYMMLNMINIDLSIFAILGLLLYSQHLYRGGFLR